MKALTVIFIGEYRQTTFSYLPGLFPGHGLDWIKVTSTLSAQVEPLCREKCKFFVARGRAREQDQVPVLAQGMTYAFYIKELSDTEQGLEPRAPYLPEESSLLETRG